ncbi:MAG: sugar ABC transporter ATP-binding protein [Lachnospiraceae bacterium]
MKLDYSEHPILEMKNVKKEFSGIYALSGITFSLYRSEVHCLVGENGAGKSTLMKVISGAYSASSGKICINGREYDSLNPALSKELGINIVYQENDLVQCMSVVENIYIGNEDSYGFGFINQKEMLKKTKKLLCELGIEIDPLTHIEDLSVSDQQFVKIVKALSVEPQILILDEPTSMFNVEDVAKVLQLTKRIRDRGIGVIYISHFLNEIQQIADRITVIRDGAVVNTYDNQYKNVSTEIITQNMVGRAIDTFYQKVKHPIGDTMLEVKGLRIKKNSPEINFTVRKGEILGLSGMVGAGRTEIVRAITGADHKYSGDIIINDSKVTIKSPEDSIRYGFAYITEDRQMQGLMLYNSVLENAMIIGLRSKIQGFFINIKKFPPLIMPLIQRLNVKTPSIWTDIVYLSGGNQQKVVLMKWLYAKQEIYIFDEPTRGIDVNAKAEFYKEMSDLTEQGKAIIMISSDMPELISMSDRILIIRDGAIDSELQGEEITEQEIIVRALGVKK